MRTQDVSAGELHQAKALLLREIVLNESSEETVARGLLARAELGLPLNEPQIASRKLYALTAAQVRAAFVRAIRPHGWVQVVRGPAPH
jgi:zinc protease